MTDEPAAAEPAILAITTPPGPTKVRIETPGVTVELEAHEPLDRVVAAALQLYRDAGGWPQDRSRSAGFAQSERRDSPPVQPGTMSHGPGPYPVQLP